MMIIRHLKNPSSRCNRHPGLDPGSTPINICRSRIKSGMTLRFLALGLIIILLPLTGFAANKKVGTSGAQFLKIGAGPRATAMGNAFVGLADDVNAVYFNPAGLSYLSRPEMIAMRTQWVEDMNYDFGAFSYPTDFGAFAISVASLKVDEIEKRGNDESSQGDFDANDSAYALSYSHYVGPLTSIGVTGRLIESKIDTESASTWSGDIGILRKLGRLPVSVGIAANHFGQEVKFRNESDPLPFNIDTGIGASLFKEKLKLGMNLKFPSDNDMQFGTGGEYNIFMDKVNVALRAGYNGSQTEADGSGVSMGAGISIHNINFDFSYVPLGDLGNTFRYALHVKF